MKKFTSVFLTGSLLLSMAPSAFAEEAAETTTANPNSAAAITNKVTGPCAGLKGFEQGRCLRTELRKRVLERRSSRATQRALRNAQKLEIKGRASQLMPKKQVKETIRKGYWTLKRDISKKIRVTRRSQRRSIWERNQEHLKSLKEKEPASEKVEEEEVTETDESREEASEEVVGTVMGVKVKYQLRGKGRGRLRRFNLMKPEVEEVEENEEEE